MKPSEKSFRPVLLRPIAIASACVCLSFNLLSSHASSPQSEKVAVCDNQGTKFKVAPQFALGRLPRAVAAGDFNNDGMPDLVVATLTPISERQLLILLGNGRGEFANVGVIRGGPSGGTTYGITNALAVADLNRDNRQDIVYAGDTGSVVLLNGKGDGSFAAPVNLVPNTQPNAVVIADFNGDGKNDIAASGRNGVVSVLPGNDDGTFGQAMTLNAGTFTATMASADLNNDGKPDLIVFAGSVSVTYLNNGSGGFTKGPAFDANSSEIAFAVGDFNGDGKQDLIYGGFISTSLRLGDGLGGFGPASSFGTSASSYVVADLNKDNRSDLIAPSNGVSVQLGGATALGARTDYAAGRGTVSAAVADFNRDGSLDVVAVNQTAGTASFLAGESGGRLQSPSPLAFRETINSLKTADLNKDGRVDLILTAGSSGATAVFLSDNAGGFASPQTYGFTFGGRDYRSTAFGDFTGDGMLDLATLGYSGFGVTAGVATIFPGTGPGVFNRDRGRDFNIGNNPDSLVAADFNRDGFADLAAANTGSNDISLLLNDGRGGFGAEMRLPSGLDPRSILTADFNGDNNPDLAVANRNSATISILLGDGHGAFNHILAGIDANPRSLILVDINRDNKPDLIIPNNNRPSVTTLLNMGSGNFGPSITSDLGRLPFDAALGDFTGDGKLDLATSGFAASTESPNERVSLFAGDDTGKFNAAGEFLLPAAGLLATGDFNSDSLADLAVASQSNIWIVSNSCNTMPPPPILNVSAASYRGLLFAPEMIVTAFGNGLTAQSATATTLPLPTELAGVSVKVKDNAGIERPAPLFFASPKQINYLMSAGTVAGSATVTVTASNNKTYSELVLVSLSSPSLFSANADGQGVAAAAILRVKYPGGEQSFEPVAQFDSVEGRFVPIPIDFGPGLDPAADQLYLVLYGTGIRGRSTLSDVTATVGGAGGVAAQVVYAGSQGTLIGLDQINLRLPRTLRGRGELDVILNIGGKESNGVKIAVR